MALAIPTIHFNGTSRETLVEGYLDALSALHNAGSVLARSATLNARDYYVQGNGAWGVAMAEHEVRMEKLRDIIGELTVIVEAIQ